MNRIVGMILNLHAQSTDMSVHQPTVPQILVPPNALQQLISRQHHVDVIGKLAKQSILGLSERKLAAALQHAVEDGPAPA